MFLLIKPHKKTHTKTIKSSCWIYC